MPHRPVHFRQTDLQRAIRGARAEKLNILHVEVAKDGGFKLVIDNLDDAAKQKWRREDDETEKWIAKQKSKKG